MRKSRLGKCWDKTCENQWSIELVIKVRDRNDFSEKYEGRFCAKHAEKAGERYVLYLNGGLTRALDDLEPRP
jgi:2-phosphoglycerate kinase